MLYNRTVYGMEFLYLICPHMQVTGAEKVHILYLGVLIPGLAGSGYAQCE